MADKLELPEIELFGLHLHALDMRGALSAADFFISERRERQVVFLNAAKFVEMDGNPALNESVKNAALRLADGQSVVWAAGLMGRPLPGRVAGIDFMQELLKRGAEKGYGFYFLGARKDVLEKAVAACGEKFGNLKIAGRRDGYFREDEENGIVRGIRDSGADVLFIGISSPRKELFVDRHIGLFGVPLVVGVGGSFDVLAGRTRRAPMFMRKAGLEWLYRLAQEPGRMWRRYLVGNTLFAWKVFRGLLAGGRGE